MSRTSLDSRDRIRHSTCGVVLAVNADTHTGSLTDVGHDRADPTGQRATVGVTEDPHRHACLRRDLQQLDAVVGVVTVAVEEVFAVDEHATALCHEIRDSVADHGEVFLRRRTQRLGHVTHV